MLENENLKKLERTGSAAALRKKKNPTERVLLNPI
jgi:hypothetical protein